MKILFDHQIFRLKYGGAPKYFAMMISSLPEGSWQTTALFSSCEYAKEKHLMHTVPYLFKGQAILCDRINRQYTNWQLRHADYDVFHQTDFGTYCLRSLGTKPMVTTYHDSNLSTIDPHPQIVARQQKSIQRADAVICVSENTKRDMLRLFDVNESKVHVVYHGIEIPDISNLPQERLIDSPYILYVGRRNLYKNFSLFAQAFSMLHQKHRDIKMVCTGMPFNNEEIGMFTKLGIADNTMHISASEIVMQRLYRDALMFVYPSLYEGFGMPILEAWSCGCPVVLSRASCFPEIADEAGLYFSPTDASDICDAMLRVVDDDSLRQQLIAKGNQRVKQFSWQHCADEHMKVYKSLI